MIVANKTTAACIFVLLATSVHKAAGQADAPTTLLQEQMRIEAKTLASRHMWAVGAVLPGRALSIVLRPLNNTGGLLGFDSLGALNGYHVEMGTSRNSKIGWVERIGRVGDAIWASDGWHKTNFVLSDKGEIDKSLAFPSWIRPKWSERHAYPIFASMRTLAIFANGDMLVTPSQRRTLFDVANYERNVVHVMRVDQDGIIQRDVFHAPVRSDRLDLRNENGQEHSMAVPFAARSFWDASADGSRITLVQPGVTVRDSGTFHVTSVTDHGDTVFTRSFAMPAMRVDTKRVDSAMKNVRGFGNQSAEKIGADVLSRIPAFRSFVNSVVFGTDHSTWIVLQSPRDSTALEAIVIDEKGAFVARAAMPPQFKALAADRSHVWGIDLAKPGVVRLGLQSERSSKPAPQARSVKAAAGRS